MRKIYLFLLLIVGISVHSQNWAPINTTEKFCYSSDDTLDIINNVLWVDSLKTYGNQEVYFMNKIVKLFDEDQNHYMFDEPQFLADTIIISEDGSWEFIDAFPIPDDGGFKIYPLEDVGFQWSFLSGISAEIISKDTLSVFGEIDSVKTIQLSNNQQIILSKEHGIVNWRDEYTLVGIEGRDIGTNVIMFEDMFKNVDAGDILFVEKRETEVDYAVIGYVSEQRFEILEIEKYIDSVVMLAGCYYYTEYNWGYTTTYSNGYSTRELKYFRNDSTDIYPNEAITNTWENSNQQPFGTTISKISEHKFGGLNKTQIVYAGEWGDASVFEECEDLYPSIYCPNLYDLNLFEYSENYGILEYQIGFFEHWFSQELVGVIDDGDTLGTIYPLDMFVGTNQLSTTSNWFIYPNPAKDHISLHSSQTGNITYQIYHYSGILVEEQRITKRDDEILIPIQELSSGVYLIKLIQNQQTEVHKFLKE